MKHFKLIASAIEVTPLVLALKRQPELWDEHDIRQKLPGTPHTQMSDIWIRYRSFDEFDPENPADFTNMHYPIWYPAANKIPGLREIAFRLMAFTQAEHLGGIIITKIPPGGKIEPHADAGWHPEFYNTKLYLPLETNPDCHFRVQDEDVVMQVGDVWWLDNTIEHEITNDGATDRITLIMCMKCEG